MILTFAPTLPLTLARHAWSAPTQVPSIRGVRAGSIFHCTGPGLTRLWRVVSPVTQRCRGAGDKRPVHGGASLALLPASPPLPENCLLTV